MRISSIYRMLFSPTPIIYGIFMIVIFSLAIYSSHTGDKSLETRSHGRTINQQNNYTQNFDIIDNHQKYNGRNDANIPIVIVLCQKEKKSSNDSMTPANALEDSQFFRQTKVLLKSIAIATEKSTRIIIVGNTQIPIEGVKKYIRQWPLGYQKRIVIEFHTFEPTAECMDRKLFKLCASVRLFLHDILPQEDSVVYVDSDFIFLESPEKLTPLLRDFNDEQLVGAAHNGGYYENSDFFGHPDYPYYGNTGISSGMLLMNLTRIRQFKYGWSTTMFNVCKSYKRRLRLYDQGVLNIIFSEFEENMYDLDCRWNFNVYYCHQKSKCYETINHRNIFAVHGPSSTFFISKSKKIKMLFQAYEKFELGEPIANLVTNIRQRLKEIEIVQPKDTDGCNEFPGLDDALLHHLLQKRLPK